MPSCEVILKNFLFFFSVFFLMDINKRWESVFARAKVLDNYSTIWEFVQLLGIRMDEARTS